MINQSISYQKYSGKGIRGLNVIIKVSRNAKGIEGTSNLMKADREQPVGGKAHVGDR